MYDGRKVVVLDLHKMECLWTKESHRKQPWRVSNNYTKNNTLELTNIEYGNNGEVVRTWILNLATGKTKKLTTYNELQNGFKKTYDPQKEGAYAKSKQYEYYFADNKTTICLNKKDNQKSQLSFSVDSKIHSVTFSEDDNILGVACESGRLYFLDIVNY